MSNGVPPHLAWLLIMSRANNAASSGPSGPVGGGGDAAAASESCFPIDEYTYFGHRLSEMWNLLLSFIEEQCQAQWSWLRYGNLV